VILFAATTATGATGALPLSVPLAALSLSTATKSHRAVAAATTLPLLVAGPAPPPMTMRTIIGGLSHGEIGRRARLWRRLTFGTGQRGTDQRPAPEALFPAGRRLAVLSSDRWGWWNALGNRPERLGLRRSFARLHDNHGLWLDDLVSGVGFDVCRDTRRLRALQTIEYLREQCSLRLLAPLRRHLAVLVLVFCVADDAAGLLDVIVDHRHDGVIRNTALARTVIVQHVAGPKPALLHALPRKNRLRSQCRREMIRARRMCHLAPPGHQNLEFLIEL